MKVSATTKEEDVTGEDMVVGVDMVEVEEMVNALTKIESHATSTNPRLSVSIVMNMDTSQKIVPSQTEERGPILLQHKPMMNRHC
jgi:predicted Zn-dependent protease